MFCLSRSHVQRIFEDIMASTEGEVHRFYATSSRDVTCDWQTGGIARSKILLKLKTFAYGDPPHTIIVDYFQMSKGLAATCCKMFAVVMKLIYDEECLRLSDALDLKRIIELQKKRHGVNGPYSLKELSRGMAGIVQEWKGEDLRANGGA